MKKTHGMTGKRNAAKHSEKRDAVITFRLTKNLKSRLVNDLNTDESIQDRMVSMIESKLNG